LTNRRLAAQETCPAESADFGAIQLLGQGSFASLRKLSGDFSFLETIPVLLLPSGETPAEISLTILARTVHQWSVDGKDSNMAITAPLGRYTRMKVVDVMTNTPLTITADETIGQADELMSENNFRQIPVVAGHELVGIVTDRDIRSFLSGALQGNPEQRETALRTPVRDIMTTEPLFLALDDDLEEAVEMLIEQKFGALPVVDEAEGLVGIVSYVDVLRCFLNRLREE
jgi:CBS domain-containing protein